MKLCQVCKKSQIDDKYQMCLECSTRLKEKRPDTDAINILKEIAQQLRYINWNLGIISAVAMQDKEKIDKLKKTKPE